MAKRAPKGDKPYRPVQAEIARSLVRSVSGGGGEARTQEPPAPQPKAPPVQPPPQPRSEPKEAEAPSPEPVVRSPRRLEVLTPSPPPPADTSRRQATQRAPTMERLEVEKRVLLSRTEDIELERLVHQLAAQTGAKVKLSHLLRAAVLCVRHAEDDLLHAFSQVDDLIRPPNGDLVGLAEFEIRIAQLLSTAIRKAPPLR